jgi:MFS family permease
MCPCICSPNDQGGQANSLPAPFHVPLRRGPSPLQSMPSVDNIVETGRSWVVALGAMICLTFGPSVLLVSAFGVFVHPLAQTFGWDAGQIGFAVSLIALSLTLVSPLQGYLIDRYGSRNVILTSILALSIGLFGMYFLPANLPVFYLSWMGLTLLAVGVWPGSYLRAVSGWFDGHLGFATGIANAGIGIGVIVVPPIAAALVASVGWRWAFVGLGALALLTLPIAGLSIYEAARPSSALGIPVQSSQSLRAFLGHRTFRRLTAGYFLVGVAGTGTVAGLIPLLIAGGTRPSDAVAIMSLFGIAAIVGRVLTGWLLDRLFVSTVMNTFVVLAAVAAACYAEGAGGTIAVGAAVLLGLLMGAEFDVLAYAVRRYFGLHSFGKAYGIVFGAFQLGAALGAGVLALSVHRTQSYRLGMGIFAVSLLISIPVFGRLGPYPTSVRTTGDGGLSR